LRVLSGHKLVIMRQHGFVSLGGTMEEAARTAEAIGHAIIGSMGVKMSDQSQCEFLVRAVESQIFLDGVGRTGSFVTLPSANRARKAYCARSR